MVWVAEPAGARREPAWPGASSVRPLGRAGFRVEVTVGRWIGEAGAVVAGEGIFDKLVEVDWNERAIDDGCYRVCFPTKVWFAVCEVP